jgi:hypothetical protein
MRERHDEPTQPVDATHNELSGAARTAAQAGIVYGGIHLYHPPQTRANRWLSVTCAVLTAISGIAISALIRLPSAGYPVAGSPVPEREILHIPPMLTVPPRIDNATREHRMNIPEPVYLRSLQVFPCESDMYARVNIFSLEIGRRPTELSVVAHKYAERLIKQFWEGRVAIQYWPFRRVRRASVSGSTYDGIQIEATIRARSPLMCGSRFGVLKGLVLDHGNTYYLVFVLASLDGDTDDAPVPTEGEIEFLVASIRPVM